MNILQILFGVLVAMLMLGLGATVRTKDMQRVKTKWKAPLVGFLCQYGFMPLIAFLLALALGVSDVVAISMIAIGATPGGSTSNLFTLFSKGDVALSITMTILSNLAAFGMLPLLLLIYTSHLTDDLQIPFVDIFTSLLLVLVPASLGIVLRYYRPRWAKKVEKAASVVGVLFIIIALVYGSISEESIWTADWELFFGGAILLLLGAGLGYLTAYFSGFSRRVCRTIALETGLQNSTFTISVLTLSFGGDGQDQRRLDKILQFPLLYSFFLVVDGILITGLFHYLAQFDPPHEQAEYEDAKRAAEIAAEEAEEGAAAELKDEETPKETELTGGAADVHGAAAPLDGVDSPHAAAEAGEGGEATPSLAPLITHDDADTDKAPSKDQSAAEEPTTEELQGSADAAGDEADDVAPDNLSASAEEVPDTQAAAESSGVSSSQGSAASGSQVAPTTGVEPPLEDAEASAAAAKDETEDE